MDLHGAGPAGGEGLHPTPGGVDQLGAEHGEEVVEGEGPGVLGAEVGGPAEVAGLAGVEPVVPLGVRLGAGLAELVPEPRQLEGVGGELGYHPGEAVRGHVLVGAEFGVGLGAEGDVRPAGGGGVAVGLLGDAGLEQLEVLTAVQLERGRDPGAFVQQLRGVDAGTLVGGVIGGAPARAGGLEGATADERVGQCAALFGLGGGERRCLVDTVGHGCTSLSWTLCPTSGPGVHPGAVPLGWTTTKVGTVPRNVKMKPPLLDIAMVETETRPD